jgi:molecular chaperone Hsp33
MDILTRWIDRSATLRIAALDATRACRTICLLHDLDGEPAVLFSQALCGALLLASDLKAYQTYSIQLDLGESTFHVDATPEGLVRGLVVPRTHPSTSARIQGRRFGQKGLLYSSVVDSMAVGVGEALEAFVLQSDQQPSHMDLQVEMGPEGLPGLVKGAWLRGFPDTKPEALSQFLSNGSTRDRNWLPASPWTGLSGGPWDSLATLEPKAFCPCSEEKAIGALKALGREELETAHEQNQELEIVCDYCHSRYGVAARTVLDALDAGS